jgi:hypothetical protein
MSADLKVPEYDTQFPRRYLELLQSFVIAGCLLMNMIVTNIARNTRW